MLQRRNLDENMFDYFYNKTTAINQSWICFNETTLETTKCVYLTVQQFNRTNPSMAYLELSFLLLLAFVTIPANIWAFVRFKDKNLNREFLIIISALCFYNCNTAFVTFIYGWGRMAEFKFPFGYTGCFITTTFACVINNSTSLTLAFLSYERRSLILYRKGLHRPSRTKTVLSILAIIFLICLILWLSIFSFNDVLHVVDHQVYDPKYYPKSQICIALTYKITIIPPEMLFGFFHFMLPLFFISYNYM